MKVSELEENISLFDLIAKDYKVTKIGIDSFRVNPCPKCGGEDHFTVYLKTNSYVSYSDCCKGGSVYNYLQEVQGMNEDQSYEELQRLVGDTTKIKKSITTSIPHNEIEEDIPLKNYTNIINELYNKQSQENRQYFINRGLTNAIIDKHKLCIGNMGHGERAIIPIWQNEKVVFYNSSTLIDDVNPKYIKATGIATFFNIDNLKTATKGEVIIICEGEFDSLSLETVGIKSIAPGETQNDDILLKAIVEIPSTKDIIFLTAFDNDMARVKAKEIMKFNYIEIAPEFNDLNEWLISNKNELKTNISQQVQTVKNNIKETNMKKIKAYNDTMSASSYINDFIGGIKEGVNTPAIPTGFKNLDRILDDGLYEGLYIIGAISSLGKTSWVLQICDQIAQQGQVILYFSLEMSRSELMAKSISRLTFINAKDKGYAKTTRGILNGKRWGKYNKLEHELIADSIQKYSIYSNNLYISEGLGTIGVKEIEIAIKNHIEITGVKPLVVIDYLQILAPFGMRSTDKQNIDKAVFELKRISREYKIPVVAISSLNKASYKDEISMAVFKESRAIEYSSDVLMELHFQNQNENDFDVNKEKAKGKRQIEVEILKNRNGETGGIITFNYYCLFNYFVETGLKVTDFTKTPKR